jgi:transcriptional regulator GlxA family with amidase domain
LFAGSRIARAGVDFAYRFDLRCRKARVRVCVFTQQRPRIKMSARRIQAVTSKPLRELQVWMLENLREDLTVEKLAERIGMSPRHFTRICVRETKMNPGQFVDRLRVEAAQQMIDSSNMGLKEIADTCGFGSADAMRRAFLRVIGITAGEYMERFRR